MRHALSPPQIDAARRGVFDARDHAERAGAAHAHQRCRLVALLVDSLLPAANAVVFDKDEETVTAQTVIALLAVRAADGTLLWYDPDSAFAAHPHAVALGTPPALDHDVLAEVRAHLTEAYDASPGHFDTSDDGAQLLPGANLLELCIPATLDAGALPAGREVVIEAPGGQQHHVWLTGDDTMVVLIDGEPAIGVDVDGPGHWRDGGVWERLVTGGTTTERYLMAPDMSEEQFHGLAPLLSLPPTWFGRWKGGPGELRTICLDGGEGCCGSDAALDIVVGYLRRLGVAYEETRTVRHRP
ncbi:MAG: hypothetical protein V7603_5055 [Micromonosporaceae bacterium]